VRSLHLTDREVTGILLRKKGNGIPLQAWTGPDVSRRFGLPDFKTVGKCRW